MPYFPFYWGDYSSKTFDLTMEQHGAYLLYMRHIYTTGQPIPDKQKFSIARALTEQQQENATFVLEKFFVRDGENWRNLRCEEIIEEQNLKHQRRVNAGRSGGIAKSAAKPKPRPSIARAKVKQIASNQNQNQSIISSSGKPSEEIAIPNFISPDLWEGFVEMRKKLKKPLTPKAQELILQDLTAFESKQAGFANEALKKSISHSWQGVFEPKIERKLAIVAPTNNFKQQNYESGTRGFEVD